MVVVKYPEWVEAQLKILDERIEGIYREYAKLKVKPDEAMRIKRNLYERIKPFVDEKVRLVANCCPTYIVDGAIKERCRKEKRMTREEAIANLNMISVAFVEPVTKEQRKLIDDTFEMAIKALEQEPTYYPPCIDCHKKMDEIRCAYDKLKEQEPILDKIRAEIDRKAHSGQWSDATMYGMWMAVQIIDKHKTSEGKE